MVKVVIQSTEDLDVNSVILSSIRREKISHYKQEQATLLSIAAEAALNKAVCEVYPDTVLPLRYSYDDKGKPYFLDIDLHFSLSHSGTLAVCAVSDKEIGVDIEKMREVNMAVADRCFTKEECEYICNSQNVQKAFFEIWTRTEARAKLTGKGIAWGHDVDGEVTYEMAELAGGYVVCVCRYMD